MDNSKVKKDFTKDEIVKIVLSLGSDDYRSGANGELIFQTICHNKTNGSYKLYYYPENCLFHCYTDCGDSFDVYELVSRNRDIDFVGALHYVNGLLGIEGRKKGFTPNVTLIDDWSLLNKYIEIKRHDTSHDFNMLSPTILSYYAKLYPKEWIDEGIATYSLEKFNIRYDISHNKIIIPHYDPKGNLIGIRGRSLNIEDAMQGKKYMPVILEGESLRHPTAHNLYGLNVNLKGIKKTKKIMLFEAEKSVLKCDGFYGDDNFTVACCGSNVSNYHRDTILNLGVKEVFIAFDKEFEDAFTKESDEYSEKILRIAYKFCPYVTTWVLWDTERLLGFKDAPCDRGKETLERLMRNKFEVTTVEGE